MVLGAQIYSLRKFIQTPQGYLETMQQLKAMGYETVQHAGAPITDAYLLRDLTQQAGLRQVCPNIDAVPILEDPDKVIETVRILGCDSIMLPYISPDNFVTKESFLAAWAPLEPNLRRLQEAGIRLAYHNHDFDVAPMSNWDGSFVQWLLENRPDWQFILDVCWAQYAQVDVQTLFDQIGTRMACVHFKDYTGGMNSRHIPVFCACGKGVVQLQRYKAIAEEKGIRDMIVEQDNAIDYPQPLAQMEQSAKTMRSLQ